MRILLLLRFILEKIIITQLLSFTSRIFRPCIIVDTTSSSKLFQYSWPRLPGRPLLGHIECSIIVYCYRFQTEAKKSIQISG